MFSRACALSTHRIVQTPRARWRPSSRKRFNILDSSDVASTLWIPDSNESLPAYLRWRHLERSPELQNDLNACAQEPATGQNKWWLALAAAANSPPAHSENSPPLKTSETETLTKFLLSFESPVEFRHRDCVLSIVSPSHVLIASARLPSRLKTQDSTTRKSRTGRR